MNFFKQKIKNFLRNHYTNARGFSTDRRILVIESDDWGAARSPSLKVVENLKKSGFITGLSHYVQNDSLASEEDLYKLFQTLKSQKDCKGKSPIITANIILANPDYERIKEYGFNEYYFEWFTETLKRYPEHRNSFAFWRQGQSEGYFYPQLHGREHLQVQRWMKDLRLGNFATHAAFEMEYYGLDPINSSEIDLSYLPAYDFEQKSELSFIKNSIKEATSKFEELFGYKSRSFVAPNYVWNKDIENILHTYGVKYIQSGRAQFLPKIEVNDKRYVRHYVGESNSLNQIYLVRNCSFEPSSDPNIDWINKCLNEIRTAFFWKKPAIIESHRVNYVGFLNKTNRESNLKLLGELLKKIVKEWPDIEFMSSDQLGDLIVKHKKSIN